MLVTLQTSLVCSLFFQSIINRTNHRLCNIHLYSCHRNSFSFNFSMCDLYLRLEVDSGFVSSPLSRDMDMSKLETTKKNQNY